NEALLAANELGKDKFEIVTPSESILAEPTVSVVDKVVEKKGTKEVAEAYLKYLYSPEGQEIAAKNYYRPRDSLVFCRALTMAAALSAIGKASAPRIPILRRAARSRNKKCR
ncbi:substrate-binding domain-containing protein, partial [Pseudomonas aeruginosa]|uniref:substrate-binding domain-containing protein n=1 Tax=Pseudomonas aeruginosa TaxID=287 RepID=UPI0031B70BAE